MKMKKQSSIAVIIVCSLASVCALIVLLGSAPAQAAVPSVPSTSLASPLATTWVVTSSADSGVGTLRAAMAAHTTAATGAIFYAKPGGLTSGLCDSWLTACELSYALTGTVSGQEIWVAAGTYRPTATTTDRVATFQLKDGVALYGGFALTETQRDQRNALTHLTILSGDIDHNDSQTPIITDLNTVTGNTTNSYHVVIGATGATLDGFVITAGYANGSNSHDYMGGGMYNTSSSPTLTNVTFSGNWADQGGGMLNYLASSPTLVTVTFSSNSANYGGGLLNYLESNPVVVNAAFSGNSAVNEGGGIYNGNTSRPALTSITFDGNSATMGGGMRVTTGSSVTLTQATFSGNSATYGGGLAVSGGSVLTNVTFYSNTASEYGGGLLNYGGNPLLTNVTFSANSAPSGGGMYNLYSAPLIRNSILWGDLGGEFENLTSTLTISNSIVQGGYVSGTHIITTDPLLGVLGFYTCPGGQCQGGGDTTIIPLLPGSSAIDATNADCPATDQRDIARGTTCDLGAFESQGFLLTKISGDNQSTPVNTVLPQSLMISVTSAFSEPVNGGVVTFVGPPGGAGTNPITTTATITNGTVAHSLIANSLPGSYPVEAHANGATSIIFTLTNIARVYLPLMMK